MGSNNKNKLIASSIIAVTFLLMLIVGATYAYFSANTNGKAITNITGRTPELSNIVISQLIDNLHIRLQPGDLNKNSEIKTYYATNNEAKNYETTEEAGTHTIARVSTMESDDINYECSANIKIAMDVLEDNSLGKVVEADDLILRITGTGLDETIDLSETKTEGEKIVETVFGLNKTNPNNIKVYVLLKNKIDAKQDYLINKKLNMTVKVYNLKCEEKITAGSQILAKNPAGLSETEIGGMKRFVGYCNANNSGCNDIVDNFVCFGYTNESDCKKDVADNDYIYRIIGIASNGEMKLIKNKALDKTYQWWSDHKSDIEWKDSLIYNALNGVDFLISLSTDWQNKIATTTWLYGDMGFTDSFLLDNTANEIYKIESGKAESWSGYQTEGHKVEKWTDTASARVGLMYISDYYYSGNILGTTNCYRNPAVCQESWLHFSRNGTFNPSDSEWTMVRNGLSLFGDYNAFGVYSNGNMVNNAITASYAVRPVFFLSPETFISSGAGTSSNPFIIVK